MKSSHSASGERSYITAGWVLLFLLGLGPGSDVADKVDGKVVKTSKRSPPNRQRVFIGCWSAEDVEEGKVHVGIGPDQIFSAKKKLMTWVGTLHPQAIDPDCWPPHELQQLKLIQRTASGSPAAGQEAARLLPFQPGEKVWIATGEKVISGVLERVSTMDSPEQFDGYSFLVDLVVKPSTPVKRNDKYCNPAILTQHSIPARKTWKQRPANTSEVSIASEQCRKSSWCVPESTQRTTTVLETAGTKFIIVAEGVDTDAEAEWIEEKTAIFAQERGGVWRPIGQFNGIGGAGDFFWDVDNDGVPEFFLDQGYAPVELWRLFPKPVLLAKSSPIL